MSETATREYLDRLLDLRTVALRSDEDELRYSPDPIYLRTWVLRKLLDDNDRDELVKLRAELRKQVEEWKQEHEVDSPDVLPGLAESARGGEAREPRRAANDWGIVRYRFGLVGDSLARVE